MDLVVERGVQLFGAADASAFDLAQKSQQPREILRCDLPFVKALQLAYADPMKIVLLVLAIVAGIVVIYAVAQAIRFGMLARVGKGLAEHTTSFERTIPESSPGEAYRVLVLGDSSAVGVGASDAAHSIPGLIAALSPTIAVENQAVSGSRAADLVTRELPTPAQPYDLILVHIGGNDVTHFTPLAEVRRDVDAILKRLTPLAKQVIILSGGEWRYTPIFPWPTSYLFAHRADQIYAVVSEVAATHGVTYVDILSYVRARGFMRGADYFAGDGFHPSDKSYQIWFDALVETAKKDGVAIPGLPTLP